MMKEVIGFVKEKRTLVAIAGFAIVVAAMMACGNYGLHVSLVALSVLVMLEALMAVMLHKVELWIHGVMVLAQIIAGVFTSRAAVSLLCVLVYAAAVAALWVFDWDS